MHEHHAKTLLELDCVPEEWRPRPPCAWLAFDAVERAALVPPGLADGLAEWLAEQRGAPLPPARAPWARPGWLAEASAWVRNQVEVRGVPELVRQWPLSSVIRFDTGEGPVYLKAVFTLFRHEPAVTSALSREHTGLVPDVVAIDEQQGYMLMRELSGELAGDRGPAAWAEAYRTAASIQRAWVGRRDELRALGAPGRGLHTLETYATRERLPLPIRDLCARLSRVRIAETIVHGDIASRAELRAAALVGEALGCVYQAISYEGIHDAFEVSDRPLLADEPDRWKQRAVELAGRL